MSRRKNQTRKRFAQRCRLFVESLEARLYLTVPAFSSLPGADHTIYLDFDGGVVENTNWNSYYNQATLNAPAYDIDGNPGAFNSTELARIEEAWKRTAEDFIPFNVNVTTVDPGSEALRKSGTGDTQWGVRAIITDESDMVNDPAEYCGCGGIAYIGSFDWSSDTPVWVYTTGGKSIAEAASHEVGHSVDLSHDGLSSGTTYYSGHGSGDTGWAPIMGVGYNRNVTTWDKGEYFDSNNGGSGANYGNGPDDLAIITTGHGFSYRADDHGDNNAGSSALSVSGTNVSGAGIIETTSDADVFSFTTGSGIVTLDIDPFTPGPNLDVKADLYDSGGNLVASSSPAATLDASFSLSLAAGQYYLHVDGTGVGDPTTNPPTGYSDYASLGRYSITGTIVDPGGLPQLSINDVSVNEADGTATFTVSVSGTVTDPVTVDFTTADGSATGGSDYGSTNGMLTFTSGGASSQPVSVSIADDALTEGTETFVANLSNATNASISDGQGVGTINDNDTDILIGDVSEKEGNLGKGKNKGNPVFKDFVFTVSLSNPVGHTVTVNYSTQDVTATTADNDYQSSSDVVTFTPGATTQTIVVTVEGDTNQEPDEMFEVILSNAIGGNLADDTGVGTIQDDDSDGRGNGGGGNGGGNDGGGGNCNPNSPKCNPGVGEEEEAAIAYADPLWLFEEPGEHGLHFHPDHDHDHEHHEQGEAHETGALSANLVPASDVSTNPTNRTKADEEERVPRTTNAQIHEVFYAEETRGVSASQNADRSFAPQSSVNDDELFDSLLDGLFESTDDWLTDI